MLPAATRLRRRGEFAIAVRSGERAASPALVVHYQRPPTTVDATPFEAVPPRVGFVVSRAVGGAVVRNRVRRRLRHLLGDRLGLLPPGARLVVRANPAAAGMSSVALAAQLDRALDRAVGRSPDPAVASGGQR